MTQGISLRNSDIKLVCAAQKIAKSLGMTFSRYVLNLIKDDLNKKGMGV